MSTRQSLEEFIRENRAELDDLKAPPGLWRRIDPNPATVSPIWKWTAVAAIGLLLISIGFIVGRQAQATPDIAGWDEFQATEAYYESRINAKMDRIKTLEVGEEVLADIQVLDEVYHQLKKQLLEDPNADTQKLLTNMIRHQQQKLEVMERILTHVDKYQPSSTGNHEM